MIRRAWRIYRDNASTFYDYRTNHKQGQGRRVAAIVFLATLVAILTPIVSLDVLSATITVQAILIGFSFSVMFFLVQDASSSRKAPVSSHGVVSDSLEKQLDEEQIDLLSKELFWNISYFNLVAFLSLLFAVALMLPNVWENIIRIVSLIPYVELNSDRFLVAARVSAFAAQWIFALLVIESAFTFVRTVGRVSFLFEQRMGGNA